MKRRKEKKRFLALVMSVLLVVSLLPTAPAQASADNSDMMKDNPVTLEIVGLTNGKVLSGDKVTFKASGGSVGEYYLVMTVDGNNVGPRIMKNGELTLTAGSFKNHYEDYVLPLGLKYTVSAIRWDRYNSGNREYSEEQQFAVSYKTPEEYTLKAKGAGRLYTGGEQWSLEECPILYKNGKNYKTPFELESVFRFEIYTEQDRTLVSQDGMLKDVGYYEVTVYELFKDEETGETLLAIAEPVRARILPREIRVDQGLLDGGKFTISADYDGEEHGIDASQVSVEGMSEDEYSISYGYVNETDNKWEETTVPPTYVNPGVYTVNITASFPTSKLLTSSAVATISIHKSNANVAEESKDTDGSMNAAEESKDTDSSANAAEESKDTESSVNAAEESKDTDSSANVAEESKDTDSSANVAEESKDTDSSANAAEESKDTDSSANTAEESEDKTNKPEDDGQQDDPTRGTITCWPPVFPPYRIQYNLNGGTNSKSNPSGYHAAPSAYYTAFTFQNPTRKGYIFKGWYTDKDYKNRITQITEREQTDLTLYAKWKKVKTKKTSITLLKNKTSKKVTLKFKQLSDASKYEVLYGTNKSLKKNGKMITTMKNTVTLKNFKKKNICYVKVRAYWTDSVGNKVYGKYSGIRKVKIDK